MADTDNEQPGSNTSHSHPQAAPKAPSSELLRSAWAVQRKSGIDCSYYMKAEADERDQHLATHLANVNSDQPKLASLTTLIIFLLIELAGPDLKRTQKAGRELIQALQVNQHSLTFIQSRWLTATELLFEEVMTNSGTDLSAYHAVFERSSFARDASLKTLLQQRPNPARHL